jgi:hypothetical protein
MLNTRLVYCISDHLGAVCMIVTRTAGVQHVIHDSSLPDDMSHERCGAMGYLLSMCYMMLLHIVQSFVALSGQEIIEIDRTVFCCSTCVFCLLHDLYFLLFAMSEGERGG